MEEQPVPSLGGGLKAKPIDKSKFSLTNTYTDGVAGEILEVIPVLNPLIQRRYIGRTGVMLPGGMQLQVQFDLEAATLEEAVDNWVPRCEASVREAVEQAKTQAFKNRILSGGKAPINGGGH